MVHGEQEDGPVLQKRRYSSEAWHDAVQTIKFNGIRNRTVELFLMLLQRNRFAVI